MEEFNDKSETIKFTPPDEKNAYVKRTQDNIYSYPRKNNEDYSPKKENETNRVLVYIAIILSILLVIVITVGIIVINSDKSGKDSASSLENDQISYSETEEDIIEEKDNEDLKTNNYSLIFHSVMKKEEGYSVLADLYDESMNEIDNRRLLINSETDIRESGERLSTEALIYAIENEAGDKIVFDATIREKDNVILSLSFEMNSPEEIMGEEYEEVEGEDEEILPEENIIENPEETQESAGMIVE